MHPKPRSSAPCNYFNRRRRGLRSRCQSTGSSVPRPRPMVIANRSRHSPRSHRRKPGSPEHCRDLRCARDSRNRSAPADCAGENHHLPTGADVRRSDRNNLQLERPSTPARSRRRTGRGRSQGHDSPGVGGGSRGWKTGGCPSGLSRHRVPPLDFGPLGEPENRKEGRQQESQSLRLSVHPAIDDDFGPQRPAPTILRHARWPGVRDSFRSVTPDRTLFGGNPAPPRSNLTALCPHPSIPHDATIRRS
jgi:hypothetical protein